MKTESKADAASSEDVALSDTLDLAGGVSDERVAGRRASYRRSLDTSGFARMFPDEWSSTMTDRRSGGHVTDIGAWDRRWTLSRRCCTGIISFPSRLICRLLAMAVKSRTCDDYKVC